MGEEDNLSRTLPHNIFVNLNGIFSTLGSERIVPLRFRIGNGFTFDVCIVIVYDVNRASSCGGSVRDLIRPLTSERA